MPLTNKKSEKFNEWYIELVEKAELMDYSPIQGCMTIRPRAFFIWEAYQAAMNQKMRSAGVQNAYFPLFIPESFLKQESQHFEGFIPEVAWVTHGGNEELAEKLAIRPTSETIMYHQFAKWIHSHRDLPLKINQWCNVIRWDTKTLKPFLRTREFLWQEGHTAHATKEQADQMVMEALGWYQDLCENLFALPVITGKKTPSETFPGALYTTTIETLMPDGKALQAGTSHQLGQNFAKMFGVKFKDQNEKEELVWQTSWGTSTRLLGAIFMMHSDDKGLVLPPRVAPIHIVIVPIGKGEDAAMSQQAAERVKKNLEETGLSVYIDARTERSPGYKFNDWELKGVPLRVEIGFRELSERSVTVARRDTGEKEQIEESKFAARAIALLDEIHNNLFERARGFLSVNTRNATKFIELKSMLETEKGFVLAGWCGDARCEEAIKEDTQATIRLIPFQDQPPEKCVMCERPAQHTGYFAKSY